MPELASGSGADVALSGTHDDSMVRLDSLRDFGELVTQLGGDPVELLRRLQIEPGLLDREQGMISRVQLVQLLEGAATGLRCPDFGMRLAAAQARHGATRALGPLDIAMRNSPTLGDAFRYCADHLHMYSSSTQLCFEKLPGDSRAFMLFDVQAVAPLQQRQGVEYAVALAQHAINSISGGRVRAREVWFTHQPLAPLSAYRTHLNATARFGQGTTGLFLDEQDLRVPVPGTNSQLYEIATSFIEHRFPAAATWLSTRVRNLIARLLDQGNCTHEHVASALRMHPRTLQRRLRDEGETFEGIKDAVRRDIALRYLQQPDVSLVRVTEILGYSETSVLSRSCHRWFSASPRELRNGMNR